jgi:hypothetical protein
LVCVRGRIDRNRDQSDVLAQNVSSVDYAAAMVIRHNGVR